MSQLHRMQVDVEVSRGWCWSLRESTTRRASSTTGFILDSFLAEPGGCLFSSYLPRGLPCAQAYGGGTGRSWHCTPDPLLRFRYRLHLAAAVLWVAAPSNLFKWFCSFRGARPSSPHILSFPSSSYRREVLGSDHGQQLALRSLSAIVSPLRHEAVGNVCNGEVLEHEKKTRSHSLRNTYNYYTSLSLCALPLRTALLGRCSREDDGCFGMLWPAPRPAAQPAVAAAWTTSIEHRALGSPHVVHPRLHPGHRCALLAVLSTDPRRRRRCRTTAHASISTDQAQRMDSCAYLLCCIQTSVSPSAMFDPYPCSSCIV